MRHTLFARQCCCLLGAACASTALLPTSVATTFSVGSPELASSSTSTLPIRLRTDAAIAALQMDVLYDGQEFFTTGATIGDLSEQFLVNSRVVSPGRLRVVIYSARNNAFENGVVFRIPFSSAAFSEGEPLTVPVVMTNIILSTATGSSIPARVAPSVLSSGLTKHLSVTSATLSGSVNPNGSAATVYFEYGPTSSYGSSTPPQQAGSGTSAVTISEVIRNLEPHTQYHFRLVATDAEGSLSLGGDRVFTTLNSKPVAENDLIQPVGGSSPVTLRVRENDVDPDGDPLAVTAVTPGSFGTVTTDGENVTYTPGHNYTTTDSFTYTVSDEFGGTSTATVRVFSGPAGMWRYSYFGTAENTGAAADGVDSDGDGKINLVEFAFGTDPTVSQSGVVSVKNGTITPGGPTVSTTNTETGVNFRAVYGRRKNYAAAGLSYTVQFSADLSNWVNSTATPTVIADDEVMQVVSVPYPFFINGRKAQFFRVKVTGP